MGARIAQEAWHIYLQVHSFLFFSRPSPNQRVVVVVEESVFRAYSMQ